MGRGPSEQADSPKDYHAVIDLNYNLFIKRCDVRPEKYWPRIYPFRCNVVEGLHAVPGTLKTLLFPFPPTSHALPLPSGSFQNKHGGCLLKSIEVSRVPPFAQSTGSFNYGWTSWNTAGGRVLYVQGTKLFLMCILLISYRKNQAFVYL